LSFVYSNAGLNVFTGRGKRLVAPATKRPGTIPSSKHQIGGKGGREAGEGGEYLFWGGGGKKTLLKSGSVRLLSSIREK